ncbi:MAG: ribosome silencing factor [Acidimicrobiia bacterium]
MTDTAPEPLPSTADTEAVEAAKLAADALEDKKALNITLLDVGELLQITEVFVVASGTSRRHVLTLGEEVADQLREHGRKPLRVEGGEEGDWVLLDFGDIVVHVFQAQPRAFYDLERLWADAPRIAWEPTVSQDGPTANLPDPTGL